jgi:hypothetical protein
MTTTVKKGAGRPAATAKRVKASQQAPEPGAEFAAMKLNELRKLAREAGWSTATKLDKAGLVELLEANPNGPPAVAPKVRAAVGKRQTALAVKKGAAAPMVRSFRPITPGLAGDGASKAAAVAILLEQAGWRVTMPKGGLNLNAKRGQASLTMVWTAKGRHDADGSSYRPTPDGKPRRVINVATAIRLARSLAPAARRGEMS